MGNIPIFRRLRGRLIVAIVGPILVAMLILVALVPEIARARALVVLEDRLADQAQLVAQFVVMELDQGRTTDLDLLAKRLGAHTQSRITIIALDGTVLGESSQDPSLVGNHAGRREVLQALAAGQGADIHYSETVGYAMLYVAVPIVRGDATFGSARAALPLREVDRLVADLTGTILFTAAIGSLIAAIVAGLAASAITRPLALLTRLAETLSKDPAQAIGIWLRGGPAEVVVLGETLERMAKGIRESLLRVEAERDRLDAVLANLSDGIVMINADGQVIRLNRAAERVLGMKARAGAAQSIAATLRDHELVGLVEEVRASDARSPLASRFLERSNPRRFLRAIASRFGSGAANQTLLVLQDLTELRRLETIRRDFVANVSHELRTPVTAIKAMAETLQQGAIDDREAAHDFLNRIQHEVDGLHHMLQELLELSRLESGGVAFDMAPVDPARMLALAVDRLAALAERAHVSLTVDPSPNLPFVVADDTRIGQVLVNLIHNAIKFTPPGGRITMRAVAEDGYVRISIADTGVGIAADELPRVFERFYKADQARAGGGSGLGLAIAKHTVQLHGGKIWAESLGRGLGTILHVALPTSPPAQHRLD